MIDLARDLGIPVVETLIPREMLYIADEVFFTGTAAEITPIRSVDRIRVGAGAAARWPRTLQKEFFAIVEGHEAGPLRLADAGRASRTRSRGQNRNFKPNWTIRIGAISEVIAPGPWARTCVGKAAPGVDGTKAAAPESELFGGAKFGLLKMLKNSARNWSFEDSVMAKFLNAEKSRFLNAGPSRMPLPELP